MAMVTVRYWAAAKQAAGVAEEVLTAGTLAEMLTAVLARHPADPALERVLARSSFLVDEDGRIERAWYKVKPEDTVPEAQAALAA